MKTYIHYLVIVLMLLPMSILFAESNFQQPNEVRSVNGTLELDLVVSIDTAVIDGRKIFTRLYNGKPTGPTLRVKPGDLLKIKIINNMPPSPDENDMMTMHNFPNKLNRTNLHTHGLFVSSKDSSDNPFIEILPGESFQYSIKIPENHQDGTFWYHPHRHGSSWAQMLGGLVGAIIVEGETDEVPEIKAATEQIMVIQSYAFDKNYNFPYQNPDATDFPFIFPGLDSTIVTINGTQSGNLEMKQGEIQRWRIINGHFANYFYITVWKDGEIVPLYNYAIDGINKTNPGFHDSVMLAVGNRADVLFKAPNQSGKYTVRFVEFDPFLLTYINHDFVEINVTAESNEMLLPSSLPILDRFKFIADEEISNNRTMEFSVDLKGLPFNIFFIDNKLFDASHSDVIVKVGDVEEWTVSNTSTEAHPFHMHINPILVTEINDQKLTPPYWCDVASIPPLGKIKFRTRYEEFDGKSVIHCHNILHGELGMMQVIEIQPKSTTVEDSNPIDLKAVYPNPVVGNLQNINFDLPDFLHNKSVNLEIFDISGNRIIEKNLVGAKENQITIDVSGFAKGSYYFKVTSGKYNNTNKFIILK